MKDIPCGRTKENKYLCCMRKHKWYNSYWVIKRLRNPDVALENEKQPVYAWEKRCLFCGHMVQLGGHPFERNHW